MCYYELSSISYGANQLGANSQRGGKPLASAMCLDYVFITRTVSLIIERFHHYQHSHGIVLFSLEFSHLLCLYHFCFTNLSPGLHLSRSKVEIHGSLGLFPLHMSERFFIARGITQLYNNNNNFIDFIFDMKISVPKQSIQ